MSRTPTRRSPKITKEANWQNGLQWMLNTDNDLVVYYNPGDLLPAAAAQFELIVQRNKYPAVFR